MQSNEYPVVEFFSDEEISHSLFFERRPLAFAIVVQGRPHRVTFAVNGCRWEQGPHGGERAEVMLVLTGNDQDRDYCELQLSFREKRARLAYYQQE